ncbi:ABC transporter substrate-binding protein [Nonomuraea sp. KC401]|uniref:ABC transporter substrate-binding protein n=1 Tax=unclassified Nonomuraea TaxID=2593643 RepID=UPI0010FDB1EC|nr:ABC transporter substrate-binding protein [Nonomuraea sp. KC401]NBE95836.1 ABC transporter substrate-binding protein [Nonomuraea sp. K271]TLF71975.1 ABC transporter substrate-binding protein [Nonomuraea sp. KC401]
MELVGDSGEFDLAQTGYLGSFQAEEKDVHVTIVGGLHRAHSGSVALVVKAGSRIRSVADVKGRKIGVPTLRGLPALLGVAMLKRGGLEPEDVVFVEGPYHYGVKNLDAGIASAFLAEPYLTEGVRQGRVGAGNRRGSSRGCPQQAGWPPTTGSRTTPIRLRAFQRALAGAHRLIAAGPGQATPVLPSYAKVVPSDLDGVELGSYSRRPRRAGLQPLADLARRHSVLPRPLDVRNTVIK